MIEPEEELDEEDLPDPGDPLDEGEEQGDLDEQEEESDLDKLTFEQLEERDRALENRSRQAAGEEAGEEEPEKPGRPAASPAQESRRAELRKRYPRSPGLWT